MDKVAAKFGLNRPVKERRQGHWAGCCISRRRDEPGDVLLSRRIFGFDSRAERSSSPRQSPRSAMSM